MTSDPLEWDSHGRVDLLIIPRNGLDIIFPASFSFRLDILVKLAELTVGNCYVAAAEHLVVLNALKGHIFSQEWNLI